MFFSSRKYRGLPFHREMFDIQGCFFARKKREFRDIYCWLVGFFSTLVPARSASGTVNIQGGGRKVCYLLHWFVEKIIFFRQTKNAQKSFLSRGVKFLLTS